MRNNEADILAILYRHHAQWLKRENFYCHQGCAACCTANVMVTECEAEGILKHVRSTGKIDWFADMLDRAPVTATPSMTTNAAARICLQRLDNETNEKTDPTTLPCPLLEGNNCAVYPVRPFSCRSFFSHSNCASRGEATLPTRIVTINTVMLQLIEHIGQGRIWGNLIEVLRVLCCRPEQADILKRMKKKERIRTAHEKVLYAERIPGFLLLPEEEREISDLLAVIAREKIGNEMVGDIINRLGR
ncbi:MAG: YkgJ family cysteine cluster protein [Thermodesulfobacteriota bacterium]